MKRLLLLTLFCTQLSTAHSRWLSKIPVDAPVHSITTINLGTYIGVRIKKRKAYGKLRTIMTEQIKSEAIRTEKRAHINPSLPKPDTEQAAEEIRLATHRQLVRFAYDMVNMRESLEANHSEYEIAQHIGYEANKEEHDRVAVIKRLVNDIVNYETWQPQLRTALFGTGAISALMILHRLGLFGSVD